MGREGCRDRHRRFLFGYPARPGGGRSARCGSQGGSHLQPHLGHKGDCCHGGGVWIYVRPGDRGRRRRRYRRSWRCYPEGRIGGGSERRHRLPGQRHHHDRGRKPHHRCCVSGGYAQGRQCRLQSQWRYRLHCGRYPQHRGRHRRRWRWREDPRAHRRRRRGRHLCHRGIRYLYRTPGGQCGGHRRQRNRRPVHPCLGREQRVGCHRRYIQRDSR